MQDKIVIREILLSDIDEIMKMEYLSFPEEVWEKRELFLEDGKTTKYEKQEHEANEFAKDLLIPEKDYQKFIEQDVFTGKSVQEFAKSINIKPSIVVGRLMHEQVISYSSQLNKLRDKYLWA